MPKLFSNPTEAPRSRNSAVLSNMTWLLYLSCFGCLSVETSRVDDFYHFACLHSDYLFKLLLIGDSGVGKSCLLLRFAVSVGCLLQFSCSPSGLSSLITTQASYLPPRPACVRVHVFVSDRMTPTQRATLALLVWTSRSGPLNWMERP